MIPRLHLNNTSLHRSQRRNQDGRASNSSYGTQKPQSFSEELPVVGVSFFLKNQLPFPSTIEVTTT